jgi:exosortase A-associated hydrolase 2
LFEKRLASPEDVKEEQVTFDSAGKRLLGMLHIASGDSKAGYVFCNAFGEERKCSCRVLVLLAREMARRGFAVLRFDYAGCGDSEGELRDAAITSFETDIRSAIDFLKSRWPRMRTGLLGLRLGASLAARLAGERDDIGSLVLLQPVLEGKTAFAADLKRRMIREMMMKGRSGGKRSDVIQQLEQGQGEVDLDGFVVSGALYKELIGLDLTNQTGSFAGRVLIVQIAPNDAVRPETESLRETYEKAGVMPTVLPIVEQPFWSRIDFIECDGLITYVCDWLGG